MKKNYKKKIFFELKLFFKLIAINFLFIINIIIIKINLPNKLKVLLCTIGKEENKYIKEFINHYRNLKIKKIILYDNNDINGEKFNKILNNEIANKFVKIINYRGFKFPQRKAIDDCYKKNNQYYDWIAFYDIDEFLYINNYTNINEFLSLPRFKKCQSIIINWKYYGDNDKLYYEPKPVTQRFTKPFYFNERRKNNKYMYSAAKSLVRGGLNIKWKHFPHYLKNIINCRPNGNISINYFSPPQYSIAYISHYLTKSTEEFAERLNRGDVILNVNYFYIKYRIYKYYFFFNSMTKEKIDLLKKKLKLKIKNINIIFHL